MLDSMLELLIKINELNDQEIYLYSELNDLLRKAHSKPTFPNSRKGEVSVKSFLKISTQLETLLPSITEQWLKDILI
ncbi:unnamed protein product, partial [marine sediment metagenome]